MASEERREGKKEEEKDGEKRKMELINAIALKRGFYMPSAEIYGGRADIAGLYGYGHLGKAMKLKFENLWRNFFLKLHDNFYEIEGTCILPKQVFEASGHLEHFNDPLVECMKCHFRFRADHLIEDELKISVEGLSIEDMNKLIKKNKLKCPKCNSTQLSDAAFFNMMFPIALGAKTKTEANAYLTPETAQQSYLAFKREFEATRRKLPLGLAVIGKVFRNEISPRQLFFRLREFTQAELQVFVAPDMLDKDLFGEWESIKKEKINVKMAKDKDHKLHSLEDLNKSYPKLYLYFLYKINQFYLEKLKIPKERFRFRELSEEERAFYNKAHFDIELNIESLGGFKEVAGLHYRSDYDLGRHQKYSQESLEVLYEDKKFVPHVIELSFGVDRNIFAFLDIFFKQEKERSLFCFPPSMAPVDLGIFPLVNKDGLPEKALEVYKMLRPYFTCFYDASDSIGRRYRRQDEIGTPFCITIDYQTLQDNTVTIRERDSMKQERLAIENLVDHLCKKFS